MSAACNHIDISLALRIRNLQDTDIQSEQKLHIGNEVQVWDVPQDHGEDLEWEKGEVEFKIVPTAAGEQAEAPGERLPDRETG